MSLDPSDLLGQEARSPLAGFPLAFLSPQCPIPAGAVAVLVDRNGLLPDVETSAYDILLTTRVSPPAPWVGVAATRLAPQIEAIARVAQRAPMATTLLARILRIGEGLDFDSALELESLAYSTLLGGQEFRTWLGGVAPAPDGRQLPNPIRYERQADTVTLSLASPCSHNAMTALMRDALYEALVSVLEDPTCPDLLLRSDAKCFSTGGAIAEFGTATDLSAAHFIRTQRSCARVLHRIGARATVHLHGACIGSGIEVPAAAARRVAAPDLLVRLPEVGMGLIPGAGGTVTLARAIGRHRLLWLALGGFRINAACALEWGLIHAIDPC